MFKTYLYITFCQKIEKMTFYRILATVSSQVNFRLMAE